MQVEKAKILYDYGTIRRIIKYFQETAGKTISDQTIRNALRFVTQGEQPDEIRKVATEKFGAVLTTETIEI